MPGADRFKFGLEGHPIEQEGRKRRLEPTPEFKAKQVKAERELLKNAVGDERELFREVLNKIEAKELIDKISDKVDQDYIHDFRNWIVGIGKRSDYIKAGVPLTSVGQAKPLSRHKSVIDFVDKLTGRVVDYYAEIVNMKMRGPGVGRHGGPATLNDLWLYFKYVVRNDPIDPKDFMEAPVGAPDPAVIGNQEGITDQPTEAPSIKDKDFGPEDKRKRAAEPDAQVRANAAPKAHLDKIANRWTRKAPAIPLDGGAPVVDPKLVADAEAAKAEAKKAADDAAAKAKEADAAKFEVDRLTKELAAKKTEAEHNTGRLLKEIGEKNQAEVDALKKLKDAKDAELAATGADKAKLAAEVARLDAEYQKISADNAAGYKALTEERQKTDDLSRRLQEATEREKALMAERSQAENWRREVEERANAHVRAYREANENLEKERVRLTGELTLEQQKTIALKAEAERLAKYEHDAKKFHKELKINRVKLEQLGKENNMTKEQLEQGRQYVQLVMAQSRKFEEAYRASEVEKAVQAQQYESVLTQARAKITETEAQLAEQMATGSATVEELRALTERLDSERRLAVQVAQQQADYAVHVKKTAEQYLSQFAENVKAQLAAAAAEVAMAKQEKRAAPKREKTPGKRSKTAPAAAAAAADDTLSWAEAPDTFNENAYLQRKTPKRIIQYLQLLNQAGLRGPEAVEEAMGSPHVKEAVYHFFQKDRYKREAILRSMGYAPHQMAATHKNIEALALNSNARDVALETQEEYNAQTPDEENASISDQARELAEEAGEGLRRMAVMSKDRVWRPQEIHVMHQETIDRVRSMVNEGRLSGSKRLTESQLLDVANNIFQGYFVNNTNQGSETYDPGAAKKAIKSIKRVLLHALMTQPAMDS